MLTLYFCIGLLLRTTSGSSVIDENSQISEITALFDHEAKVVLYKDPSLPACFIQLGYQGTIQDFEENQHEIILTGQPWNTSTPTVMVSQFQKEFCSNLPLFEMESNSAATQLRHRVHRTRRRRNTNGYSRQNPRDGRNTPQQDYYFPGSQTQVEGNLAGNGQFSGQAQSMYGGLSQSKIQLGGVGLTGTMSSVAGGTQSGLRLGARSGFGQISSSGNGQSASELQLNLGEPGQESRAHAIVMQQHQPGSLSGQDGSGQQLGSGFSGQGSAIGQESYADSGNLQSRFPYSTYTGQRSSGSQGVSRYGTSDGAGFRQQEVQSGQTQQGVTTTGAGSRTSTGMGQTTRQDGRFLSDTGSSGSTFRRTDQNQYQQTGTYANGADSQAHFRSDSVTLQDLPGKPSAGNGHGIKQPTGPMQEHSDTRSNGGYQPQGNGFRTNGRQPAQSFIPEQGPSGGSHRPANAYESSGAFQQYPISTLTQRPNGQYPVEGAQIDPSGLQLPRQNGYAPTTGRVPDQNGGIPRGQTPDDTDTQLAPGFQPPRQNGYAPTTGRVPGQNGGIPRGQTPDDTDTHLAPGFQPSRQNGHVQPSGRVPGQNGGIPRGQTPDDTDTQLAPGFQPSRQNGHAQPSGRVPGQNGGIPRGQTPDDTDTQLAPGFQPSRQNGHVQPSGRVPGQNGGIPRGQTPDDTDTQLAPGFQPSKQNGHVQPPGRVPGQNGGIPRSQTPDDTDTQLAPGFQPSRQNGQPQRPGRVPGQNGVSPRGQPLDETDTEVSPGFQPPRQNGQAQRPEKVPGQSGMSPRGQLPDETDTEVSPGFQGPRQNGQVQRPGRVPGQNGGLPRPQKPDETETRFAPGFQPSRTNGQGLNGNGGGQFTPEQTDFSGVFQSPQQTGYFPQTHQTDTAQNQYTTSYRQQQTSRIPDDSSVPGIDRSYTQTSARGQTPAMTSYPGMNGRRVYQRRVVTYYPGETTPVTQHYVQQSMTGQQPQPGQTQPPGTDSNGSPNCLTMTFQCTVFFDGNGKSKLCQPKPVNNPAQQSPMVCCC